MFLTAVDAEESTSISSIATVKLGLKNTFWYCSKPVPNCSPVLELWKPEVVENDPFKNLRGNESFDELLELGGNKIKKFNPFKKEGKKIDFGKYYDKRKRGKFDERIK